MEKIKIALSKNGTIGSCLITTFMEWKNLRSHLKIIRENKKGILLNGIRTPYMYLKTLIKNNPKLEDEVAIIQDEKITYREVINRAEWLSNYLHFILNEKKGSNISICAASSIEGIICFFALNNLGLVNARIFNGSQSEKMEYNIKNFKSETILVDKNNIDVLSTIASKTRIRNVIVISECNDEKIERFKIQNPHINIVSLDKAIEIGRKQVYIYHEVVESEDLASILYTSGSSGEPKPISIPNRVYTNMVDIVCKTTNIKKCDKERVVGVVSHEYPYAAINCTIMILLMGKTLIMPSHKNGNELDFNQLNSHLPNRIQAIPNFYKLLEIYQQNSGLDIKNMQQLNSIVSGGERYLKSEKIKLLIFFEQLGLSPLLIDGFGFGELGSAAALKFGLNNYFLLMNGVRAKAIDPKTHVQLPTGVEGLLCFNAPTIAAGYYNDEEATEKSFVLDENNEKWFVSDTYGSVHGKLKRLIELGGRVREYFITSDGQGNFVKVYAGTVEDVISSVENIEDCIVVQSDNGATPSPVAYISLKNSLELEKTLLEIKEKCERLEKFAQPTELIIEEKTLRTAAGKKDYTHYKTLRKINL